MAYSFREWIIPDHMLAALRRYIDEHRGVGHFLTAVLENNLREAVHRADEHNLANLPAYVYYLYNEAPAQCWGSPEKVKAWLTALRHTKGQKREAREIMKDCVKVLPRENVN